MSGYEEFKGPWWKLRQTDARKQSWLKETGSIGQGNRIVFYVWWWAPGDTSAFFAAGDSENNTPLQGRFSLGASPGKVIRVELVAPKPDPYGLIWIHFNATGKFALSIGKIYDQPAGR